MTILASKTSQPLSSLESVGLCQTADSMDTRTSRVSMSDLEYVPRCGSSREVLVRVEPSLVRVDRSVWIPF